jgi:hypothetical protein
MKENQAVKVTGGTLRERLESLTQMLAASESELATVIGTEVQNKPNESAPCDGTLMAAHQLLDLALDQARHIQSQIARIGDRL